MKGLLDPSFCSSEEPLVAFKWFNCVAVQVLNPITPSLHLNIVFIRIVSLCQILDPLPCQVWSLKVNS